VPQRALRVADDPRQLQARLAPLVHRLSRPLCDRRERPELVEAKLFLVVESVTRAVVHLLLLSLSMFRTGDSRRRLPRVAANASLTCRLWR